MQTGFYLCRRELWVGLVAPMLYLALHLLCTFVRYLIVLLQSKSLNHPLSTILTECWRMMHHKIYASVFFQKQTTRVCVSLIWLLSVNSHFTIVIVILITNMILSDMY